MAILQAHNLYKSYRLDHRVITVLENISLTMAPGEFTVISGSSGSGKTTLLNLLSGLDQPTSFVFKVFSMENALLGLLSGLAAVNRIPHKCRRIKTAALPWTGRPGPLWP